MRPQLLCSNALFIPIQNGVVRHQTLLPWCIFPDPHHRLPHPSMFPQPRLNLPKLNPISQYLYLNVVPPQKLYVPLPPAPRSPRHLSSKNRSPLNSARFRSPRFLQVPPISTFPATPIAACSLWTW